MHTTIEVKTRREGDAIRRGLNRADVRAFALIIGELETLPDDRTRARVLRYITEVFAPDTPIDSQVLGD